MDIKILTDHFLFKSGDNVSFDEDVYTALESYSWPGNIRQLEKWINRICRYYKNTHIQWEDIPDNIKPDLPSPFDDQVQYPEYPINYYEYTNNLRKRALEFAGGNQARAAELLSIKPTTMRQWVLKQKKQ
jgi:DNA-binding NtrC family response regulator